MADADDVDDNILMRTAFKAESRDVQIVSCTFNSIFWIYSPEQVPEKTIWTNYRAQQRILAGHGLTVVNSLLFGNHGNENQENEMTAPYETH